jgi:hypothetical protein
MGRTGWQFVPGGGMLRRGPRGGSCVVLRGGGDAVAAARGWLLCRVLCGRHCLAVWLVKGCLVCGS